MKDGQHCVCTDKYSITLSAHAQMHKQEKMSRYWTGTSYSDTWTLSDSETTYQVYQREKCSTTGREHWQFFVIFKQRKRFSTVKNMLPGAHIEIARCVSSARKYCMKDDTRVAGPTEIGEFPSSLGDSPMLQKLRKRSVLDVIEAQPNLWRSVRSLQSLQSLVQEPRMHLTQGIVFWGRSGSGKTRIIKLISQYVGTTYWKDSTQWWQDYANEKLVIWDEFREDQSSLAGLLSLMNHTPMRIPVKGTAAQFNSDWILFSTNVDPSGWYSHADYHSRDALKRRIKSYEVY